MRGVVVMLWVLAAGPSLAKDRPAPEAVVAIREAPSPEGAVAAAEALVAAEYRRKDARAAEAALREVAHDLYRGAITARDKSPLDSAVQLHALYLERFPTASGAHTVAFERADALYALKRYEEAWAAGLLAADIDPDGEHAAFCVETSIFAADEMRRRDPPPPFGAREPVPLDVWDVRLVDAIRRFVDAWPASDHANNHRSRAGHLLHAHNQLDDARVWLADVVHHAPRTTEAADAAALILDGYANREDWDTVRALTVQMQADPELATPEFQAELAMILEQVDLIRMEDR